ncbi:SET and mynd domain containing, putative [Babesia caballi]|uniref:SET and mynd domain containing, putative n=1 Tax=Babesia caballi TaxID=5871 RepID=A0AAV4LTS8_BABCB|nr:SET and mynd domain containing, putative [Babesia caballi]
MAGSHEVTFDTFLDEVVVAGVLDLNYDGVLPRLLSSIKRSCSAAESALFNARSNAAAIFLKASIHKDSYRRCRVEPIFKLQESQKYLQQRRTIVQWFKRADKTAHRRDPAAREEMNPLTRMMCYIADSPRRDPYHMGDDLVFSDSDDQTAADSATVDAGDPGSAAAAGDTVGTQIALVECSSNKDAGHTIASQETVCYGSVSDGEVDGLVGRHDSVKEQCPDPGGSSSAGMNKDTTASDISNTKAYNKTNPHDCDTSGKTSDCENVDCADLTTHEHSSGDATKVHQHPTEDHTSSEPNHPAAASTADSADAPAKDQPEGAGREYFCNTSILLYGSDNLVTPCYYFIGKLLSKSMGDLVAYPDHMRSKHSFVLWQNPWLQHLCCRELRFAYLNNEVTFSKVLEVLSFKKSKCCVLENFDLLPEELQLVVTKHVHKNERLFIFLSQRISQISRVLKSFSFNFRVPPVNTDKLVEAALSQKLCPALFAGIARTSITDFASRAREDILLFYRTMVALQQKKPSSARRDTLALKRLVHCIAFQEKNLRTIAYFKETISSLLPVYTRDPSVFWLTFMEEVDVLGRPHLQEAKEEFYHLIARKSTMMAQMTDPRLSLEATFLEMMDIINGKDKFCP